MTGMRRKWMSIAAVALLLAPLCAFLWSLREPPKRETLSELPDGQILKFLAFYEVEIPEELREELKNEEKLVRAVRLRIVNAENNPSASFAYASRQCINDLAQAIRDAVNEYYGVRPQSNRYPLSVDACRAIAPGPSRPRAPGSFANSGKGTETPLGAPALRESRIGPRLLSP